MNDQNHSLGGKYLTFNLKDEEYGIQILKIVEIIKHLEIRELPQTPSYLLGLINLRSKVIPVMDLRLRFGIDAKEVDEESVIIIIQTGQIMMGLLVDRVKEVIDIHDENIDPTPDFGSSISTDYILAMGKLQDRVTILLDIDHVLTHEIKEMVMSMETIE